jgi:cell fate regulator YaaT (PSP1 superfamily)
MGKERYFPGGPSGNQRPVMLEKQQIPNIKTTEPHQPHRSKTLHLKDEKRVFSTVQQCILKHKLEMKLIKVVVQEDDSKTTVYYTADGRIDFRELLKTLAAALHCRIEMRQIGARNAAKLLGGIGICGRQVCCASFLQDFEPVSLRISRRAGCCHDPSRLTGICGKLRCCHTYESMAPEEGDLVEILEELPEL